MLQGQIIWLRGLTGGLALIAALVCSVMPGGLIPKVAGKCGQVLCTCVPEPVCRACALNPTSHSHPKCNVTLVTTTISGVDAPGLAFQVVLSGMIAPMKTALTPSAESVERACPEFAAFAASSVSSDIATPPPKA